MLLASLTDVKLFLELTNSNHDTLLNMLIEQVSKRVETFLNRKMEKTARTEYYNAGRKMYYLPAYPIDLTAALTITHAGSAQTINDDFFIKEWIVF
jgi:hypothetical protein